VCVGNVEKVKRRPFLPQATQVAAMRSHADDEIASLFCFLLQVMKPASIEV
jgi:hypothetical protein